MIVMNIDEVRKRNLWLLIHPKGYTDQGVKLFAEKTGKSEQRIRHLIGKTVDAETVKPLGKRACRDFEETLELELFWFDTPHFDDDLDANRLATHVAHVKPRRDMFDIIQHTEVHGAMGHGTVLNDGHDGAIQSWRVTKEWAINNIPSNSGLNNLRIVTGKGDSMKGMYNDGDPLIIDTGIITVDYDAVYFFRIGERGYIKRLQGMPDGTILAISKNQDYRDFTIDDSMDFHIFGRVLKVWKGESF